MDATGAASRLLPPDGSAEPIVRRWQPIEAAAFVERFIPTPSGRPVIVAVDGRGGAGKSTLGARLASVIAGSAVIATDDVAWNHAMFDWGDQLAGGVLEPLRRGEPVGYRPPGWVREGRTGSITVPDTATVVFVEGVGASRAALAPLVDVAIWVQSDHRAAYRLGIDRDVRAGRARAEAIEFWHHWMSAEAPFLEADRPWSRADVVVAGVPRAGADQLWWSPPPAVETTA